MAPTWLMPKLESSFNLTRNVTFVYSKIMLEEAKKKKKNHAKHMESRNTKQEW
jgi:hypothetical protein